MKSGSRLPINPLESDGRVVDRVAAAVALRRVTFGYEPTRPVLQDVSVELRPGRVTALLGPNGSGKSTLLKMMLNQATPWAGEVSLHGQPITAFRGPALARQISYVPQRGGVGFAFTVREVVAMGRFAFGDEEFVDEALDKTGLADAAHRVFAELSGGQQQRVLIARAWAQSRPPESVPGTAPAPGKQQASAAAVSGGKSGTPTGLTAGANSAAVPGSLTVAIPRAETRVILADEPASSLDLHHAHAALGLLREMADEGLAVLVVLHGLGLAERWADEVWLMDRGRLVARGGRDEVLRPDVLEPVYGVKLGVAEADGRRVFYVREVSDRCPASGTAGEGTL